MLVRNRGAEGNRTPDLIAASDALYQLSYSPVGSEKNIQLGALRNQKREIFLYLPGQTFKTRLSHQRSWRVHDLPICGLGHLTTAGQGHKGHVIQ